MESCSIELSDTVEDEKLHKVSPPNKDQQSTPENNIIRKNIDNSIFNTISKIVNPTKKVSS